MGTLVKKRFNMQCHLILSNEILFLIFLIQKKIRSLVGDSTRIKLISIMSFRSSHQRYSIQKGILKNFTKFPGKHLCQNLFFNKDAGLRLATLLKNRPWYSCFPVNFEKFLGIPILKNICERLLLDFRCHFF